MDTEQAAVTTDPEESIDSTSSTPFGVRASWQVSLDNIQAALSHEKEPVRELLVAAYRWCIDDRHPMSRAEFARRCNYSNNTIYRIYAGKYLDAETKARLPVPDDLIRNVKAFLDVEQQRFLAGRTEFVMTPSAKRIHVGCDLARESQTIVIMWGPSHIGKTWALRDYSTKNNHGRTILVELDAASGLGGMVRRIAESCGVSQHSNTNDLVNRIKRAITPNTLLIIDEVHLLHHTYRKSSFFSCIEVLRRIHDHTQCGMVLSWTILDNLRAASQGELQQVWRRGVHKIALPLMPTKGDISAILRHAGMEFPDRHETATAGRITEKPYEVLHQVAKRDGLKAITERIRYARRLAGKSNEKVRWDHFIDAHIRIARESVQQVEWEA